MGRYCLEIPDFHPTKLNELLHCHWAVAARKKKADREMIAAYTALAGIPPAPARRRLTLVIVLSPKMRAGDGDSYWKSLLDACTACGLIKDDNRQWLDLAPVEFCRGERRRTLVILEDID